MQALAVVPQHEITQPASLGFEPQSMDDVWRLAKVVIASQLAPRSVKTPEAAMVMIMTGRELGLTAMQSLRSIHVVEGKPLLSADLMLALALRLPTCEMFVCTETTDTIASFVAKRRGQPETRLSFTAEQAKNAGLSGKDNWKKYAAAMLRARAIAGLARLVFPDAFVGVYEENEIAPAQREEPRRVQTDVRPVDDSQPAPAIAAAPKTNTLADELRLVSEEMEAAKDAAALNFAAAKINALKPYGLTESQRAQMMRLYSERKTALAKPVAAHADVASDPDGTELGHELDAPHMREPGEEG